MQTHELLFINPMMHGRLNVTVRKGDKWCKALPGDRLSIRATAQPGNEIGEAEVLMAVPWHDSLNIPPAWLKYEHDPSCTTQEGLNSAMDQAYPDGWVEEGVTILFFMVD
jgi:hypothetical protein